MYGYRVSFEAVTPDVVLAVVPLPVELQAGFFAVSVQYGLSDQPRRRALLSPIFNTGQGLILIPPKEAVQFPLRL
jgi:hypothetical protein